MSDVMYYERRKEMFKIDELMERYRVRSSETCFALDEIERTLNEKDEEILYLKNANNHNNDISAGKIQHLESELKKRDELFRECYQLISDIGNDEIVYYDAKIRCRDFLNKPEIKTILERK